MKKHLALLLTLCVLSVRASDFSGNINLQGAQASDALTMYTKFSGRELKIDKNVNLDTTIFLHANFINKLQAASLIATNLHTQANIIITPLDDKHASVKLGTK